MKKNQIKRCLDSISEMNDEEIEINKDFIRKVAVSARELIINLDRANKNRK